MPSLNTPARARAEPAQTVQSPGLSMPLPAPDLSGRARRQSAQRAAIDGSPAMAAQRARIRSAFGPAAGAAPVQRLTFTIGRRDPDAEEKRGHITAQNERIEALDTLYVNDAADTAMEGQQPSHPTEATREEGQDKEKGDELNLLESCTFKYQSRYHTHVIELVTSPDHDPRGDDAEVGALKRIHDPYRIKSSVVRGGSGGGDIGRSAGGPWAWELNPDYQGLLNAPNLGGYFHPVQVPQPVLSSMLGMPEEHRFGTPGTEGLTPLTAPPTQPLVYYRDQNFKDPTHRHDDRRTLPPPSTALTLLAPPVGPSTVPLWQQSTFSEPPKTSRKGERDPGKEMGGPASDLMPSGWKADARRGMQASHEWCHLVGDADGGLCAGRNLVIGTNQVNTEQLALENALRPFRPELLKMGRGIYIDASATGTMRPASATGEPVLEADWIKYTISVRHLDGSGEPLDVHTELMDARRGTITPGEFRALRNEATARLEVVMRQLRAPTVFDVPYGGSWPLDPQAQQHPHVRHNQELLHGSPSAPRPVPRVDEFDSDGFRRPSPGGIRHGVPRYEPYGASPQGRRLQAEQRARQLIRIAMDDSQGDDARLDARNHLRMLLREITNTDLQQLIQIALRHH